MAWLSERRSALLKLIGATIVFVSAVSQHFQYEVASREIDRLSRAIQDQALIDKGALINQTSMYVLYMDSKIPEREVLLAQHARQVALKLYQGSFVFITSVSETGDAAVESDLATLRAAASRVEGVESLSDYMGAHNRVVEKYSVSLPAKLQRLRDRLASFELVYMGLYLLGGLLLFAAGWIDWTLAPERTKPFPGQARAARKKPLTSR